MMCGPSPTIRFLHNMISLAQSWVLHAGVVSASAVVALDTVRHESCFVQVEGRFDRASEWLLTCCTRTEDSPCAKTTPLRGTLDYTT